MYNKHVSKPKMLTHLRQTLFGKSFLINSAYLCLMEIPLGRSLHLRVKIFFTMFNIFLLKLKHTFYRQEFKIFFVKNKKLICKGLLTTDINHVQFLTPYFLIPYAQLPYIPFPLYLIPLYQTP